MRQIWSSAVTNTKHNLYSFLILLVFSGCYQPPPKLEKLNGVWVATTPNQHTLSETILKLKKDGRGTIRVRNMSIDDDNTKNFSTTVEYPITWSAGIKVVKDTAAVKDTTGTTERYYLAMTTYYGKIIEINTPDKLKTEMRLMNEINSSYEHEDTLDFSEINKEIIWYQKGSTSKIKMLKISL